MPEWIILTARTSYSRRTGRGHSETGLLLVMLVKQSGHDFIGVFILETLFLFCFGIGSGKCSVVMEVQRYLWPLIFAILGTHVENMFRLNKYGPCAIDS